MVWRLSNRRGGNDTRAGPLLPERAQSECARSTAAVGPTRVPFPKRGNKQAWKDHIKLCSSDASKNGTWTLPSSALFSRRLLRYTPWHEYTKRRRNVGADVAGD